MQKEILNQQDGNGIIADVMFPFRAKRLFCIKRGGC